MAPPDSLAGGAKQNDLESLLFFGGLGETCRDPNTVTTVTTHCPKRCATKMRGHVWSRRHQLAWQASGDRWHGRLCGRECAAQKNDELSEIPDSFDALNYRSWLLNSGCWLFLL